MPKTGHAVSVYYPTDVRTNAVKYWIPEKYREGDRWNAGVQSARTWYMNLSFTLPTWMLNSWRDITIDVEPDGALAADFNTGSKKLIPIVFSHGLTGSRTMYSVLGRELASCGYAVFLIDHHDGSTCFTMKHGKEPVWFNKNMPYFSGDDMHNRVKTREQEMKMLIDCISLPSFATQFLKFKSDSILDLPKLVMAGHSMGGAASIRVGHSDPRVKCILTHDPWLMPVHKEIYAKKIGSMGKDKSYFVLNTETFHGL